MYRRSPHAEWDLAYLSPSLDDRGDAADTWRKLLSHLIVLGAQQGIERIYARCAEDAEVEDILRQVGFTVVCREEVFVLSKPPAPAPLPKGLRRLDPRHERGLLELYHQVEPRQVHQAEDSSRQWCAAAHLNLTRSISVDEYVWTGRDQIIAHLQLLSSAKGYWLEVVVRPEHRGDLLPYIKYLLTLTQCSSCRPVYCSVPDYGVGLGWLLRTQDFESYVRQTLLVAHTVSRVAVRRQIMIPGLGGSVDIGTPARGMFQNSGKRLHR